MGSSGKEWCGGEEEWFVPAQAQKKSI